MKSPCLSVIAACCLLLSACAEHIVEGHGTVKTETRQLSSTGFTKVAIHAPVDVHITVGGAPSLSLEGYANLMPYLHTTVRDNTLRIFVDEYTELHTGRKVQVNISMPSLSALDLSGSCDAVVSGLVNSPDFALDVSGAASVDISEIHVNAFSADMSGSADLRLGSGQINTGSFDISGSGAIKAFGVTQQNTTLDLTGSADAEVTVAARLDVDISGAGNVAYKGHPNITQDVNGAGSIRDAN
jgi:hypothetical protein